ncbi:hypothetical protein JCM8097_003233 [Rhodosporidiobolus ruineniae]
MAEADPFPLLHLADLDFDLVVGDIPNWPSCQLALAHLHPDWEDACSTEPSLPLKVKQNWRKRREKARKDIVSKVPMGAFANKEDKEKEGTAFARFELVDLGYEVVGGQLERLTSAQLAAIVFHPKTSEALVEEAAEIFANRRELDFARDLSPPSVSDPAPSAPAPAPTASAAPPPPPPSAAAPAAVPPAPIVPAPTSRLPARRAPPPPPPPPSATPAPTTSRLPASVMGGGASVVGSAAPRGSGDDSDSPLPFGLPGLHSSTKLTAPPPPPSASASSRSGREEDKAKSLKEREKEEYKRAKEASRERERDKERDARYADDRDRERAREREKERERERSSSTRDSPGRSRSDRDRRRSRSRDRRDRSRSRDRRDRDRSPARSSTSRRESTSTLHRSRSDRDRNERDRLDDLRSPNMAKKRSRDDEKERDRDRDERRSTRGASPARSDASSLRGSVRRRVDDYPRRDRSRSPPPRRETPPPEMPHPSDYIPMSLQDSLEIVFLRHFPGNVTGDDVAGFVESLFPPGQNAPRPIGVKLAVQRVTTPGQPGLTPGQLAFVAFEHRNEAYSVISAVGAQKRTFAGMDITASPSKEMSKSVWRWSNLHPSFIDKCHQRVLAAYAARKTTSGGMPDPFAQQKSLPPPPPMGLGDANAPLPGPSRLPAGAAGLGGVPSRLPNLPTGPAADAGSYAHLPPPPAFQQQQQQQHQLPPPPPQPKSLPLPQSLQTQLFTLRIENLPGTASLGECRDFFDDAQGLVGLALDAMDFARDLSTAWLAFEHPGTRDNAKHRMFGARFPTGRMKLWVEEGEKWVRKTGMPTHVWMWNEMSKDFRNRHADEYKRALDASGMPGSPITERPVGYERDRTSSGGNIPDANGDISMARAVPPHLQAPQAPLATSTPPFSPANGFEVPRRPGPSPSMLPQSLVQQQMQMQDQEYSPAQPDLGLGVLPNANNGAAYPPRPQAAFLDGSYGQPWRPAGVEAPAGAASVFTPSFATPPPPPPQQQQQHYIPTPPIPAAVQSASKAASGGIHPARLAMLASAGGAPPPERDEDVSMSDGPSGGGGGGGGGGVGEERLTAAEEKKVVEETQRNAWGARRGQSGCLPPASAPNSPSIPIGGAFSPTKPIPTGPASLTVKGLARSPPSAPAVKLLPSGRAPINSPRPGSPNVASRTSALAQLDPAKVSSLNLGTVTSSSNGSGSGTGAGGFNLSPEMLAAAQKAVEASGANGSPAPPSSLATTDPRRQPPSTAPAASASTSTATSAGQRRKLEEKLRYEQQKREQREREEKAAAAANGANGAENGATA